MNLLVLIAALLVSFTAFGEKSEIKINSQLEELHIGGEYRFDFTRTDHGLQKSDDETPAATSSLNLAAANLIVTGKIDQKTEFKFKFRLNGTGNSVYNDLGHYENTQALIEGFGVYKFSKRTSLAVGRLRVRQGGWDNLQNSYQSHMQGIYRNNLPFYRNESAAEIRLQVGGQIILQLVNDRTLGRGAQWNENEHPTYIFSWLGKFGKISPLLNIGTWDNQKSHFLDVGVYSQTGRFKVTLDYNQTTIGNKGIDADGESKQLNDIATHYLCHLRYSIPKSATPFLYFSKYEKKQNEEFHGEDKKYNSLVTSVDTPFGSQQVNESPGWDDNGVVMGVGADLKLFGDGFTPYFALVNVSGKMSDPTDSEGKEKSEMLIKMGVYGGF